MGATENGGNNSGGVSEETERVTSAYPAVKYFLEAVGGSPQERTQKAALMLQEFFQGSNPVAMNARSALREYCRVHKLHVPDYLGETPLKKNGRTDLTVTS